jgi:peptide/nickel transport system permease protein
MAQYAVRRLLWAVVAVIGVSAITYGIAYGIPANPARLIAGQHASAATVHAIYLQLHLYLPLWQRWLLYLWGMAHGNFGYSFVYHRPVLAMVAQAAPATFVLAVAAIVCELIIGITVGVVSAVHKGKLSDTVLTVGSLVGISMPTYWMGMLLLLVFGFYLGWFPLHGYSLSGVVLPALSVGLTGSAFYARVLRATMLEMADMDYVRTARAKGLPEGRVLARHLVRNALIPLVTLMGLDFSSLLGGLIVSEVIFGWPGLGLLANQAIGNLDEAVIEGVTLYAACAVVLMNLLVDLVYALLDPRISYS